MPVEPPSIGVVIKYGGTRLNKLLQTIFCILDGGLEPEDIVVVGAVGGLREAATWEPLAGLRCLHSPQADRGRLGAMINEGAHHSTAEFLVVCDDDILFPDGFFAKLRHVITPDIDVLSFGVLNTDGSRYWDNAECGKRHVLRPLGLVSPDGYVTGGAFGVWRRALLDVPFDDALTIGHGEDVEWSRRAWAAGLRWHQDQGLAVIHNDGRCHEGPGHVLRANSPLEALAAHRRAYRRRDCWIPPGHHRMDQAADAAAAMTEGWHPPEDWGAWTAAPWAVLAFSTVCRPLTLALQYRCRPTQAGRHLRLVVNGTVFTAIAQEDSGQTITLSLPEPTQDKDAAIRRVMVGVDSSAFGGYLADRKADGRWLGIGLERISLIEREH